MKEVAEALLEGNSEGSLFVGSALLAWLENGGDLVRDYLQIAAPRGSHRTVQSLLSLIDEDEDELP